MQFYVALGDGGVVCFVPNLFKKVAVKVEQKQDGIVVEQLDISDESLSLVVS